MYMNIQITCVLSFWEMVSTLNDVVVVHEWGLGLTYSQDNDHNYFRGGARIFMGGGAQKIMCAHAHHRTHITSAKTV